MRRFLAVLFALLIISSITTACSQTGTTGSTSPDPMIHTWDTTIYLTRITWDETPITTAEAPVKFTVSDYMQQPDVLDMQYFPLCVFSEFDMGECTETFQLSQDTGLPYYCGQGSVDHLIADNSRYPMNYAIDVQHGFMIIITGIDSATGRPESYWVGSLDSNVDASDISEHFQRYLDYIVEAFA